MADNYTDKLLFDAIKADNDKAFKVLFLKYYKFLCNYALGLHKDKAIVEELVSDLFLHLWNERKVIIIKSNLKSYLLAATKNRVLNFKNSQQFYQNQLLDDVEGMEIKSGVYGPMETLVYRELHEKFEKSVSQLPEQRLAIFRLHKIEGLSYNEVAEKLQLKEKTIRNQVHRALKMLKDTVQLLLLLNVFRE